MHLRGSRVTTATGLHHSCTSCKHIRADPTNKVWQLFGQKVLSYQNRLPSGAEKVLTSTASQGVQGSEPREQTGSGSRQWSDHCHLYGGCYLPFWIGSIAVATAHCDSRKRTGHTVTKQCKAYIPCALVMETGTTITAHPWNLNMCPIEREKLAIQTHPAPLCPSTEKLSKVLSLV